ncbi:MAG: signal peptidase I [Helicobacteraceae bacterium]
MKDKLQKLYRFSNSWTGTVIIVLLAIFFFAQAFVIPSGSMKYSLLEGDFLVVKKFSYGIPTPHIPWLEIPVLPDFDGDGHLIKGDEPKRGDIVVFRYPKNEQIHFVKRLFALGDDEVYFKGKDAYLRPREGDEFIRKNYPQEQVVDLDGKLWVKNPYKTAHPGINNDDYVYEIGVYPPQVYGFGPARVRAGEFFMVGDNREHSDDSRSWGSVPYKNIVGKPWFVYLSWENRSFDNATGHKNPFLADYRSLKKVCKDLEPFSAECEKLWEKQRYVIRWDRIGKTPEGLEKLLNAKL